MRSICLAILFSSLALALSSCNSLAPKSAALVPAASTSTASRLVDTGSLAGWGQSTAAQAVSDFKLGLALGRAGPAVQISYGLGSGGWVSIWQSVDPRVFSGAAGISFYYKGSGASNTIEVKLRLLFPGDTEETYFYASDQISTNTGGKWKLVELPYRSFVCRQPANYCAEARIGSARSLDPTKVVKIDLAIANKSGDKAGSGELTLDDVVGLSQIDASKIINTANLWTTIKILLFLVLLAVMLFLPRSKGNLSKDEIIEMNNTNRPWAYEPGKKK